MLKQQYLEQLQDNATKQGGDGDGTKGLCLLSLDGGGVRGLSTLVILDELMRKINPNSPPKPCEIFDMIGGTSTGG
jgi:patatin-like phospholipase/acyl hydrolase